MRFMPIPRPLRRLGVAAIALAALALTASAPAVAAPFLNRFPTETMLASTVPANGDVNPYGIVQIRHSVGSLVRGGLLVSNFNAAGNLQGTGTTIVQVSPGGQVSLFASIDHVPPGCGTGVGLTTALAVLRGGLVVVGSLPTTDGTAATAQPGCLIALDAQGRVVATLSGGPIAGPWDMTAVEHGDLAALFVTNVLNGTVAASPQPVNGGTVVRLIVRLRHDGAPRLLDERVIATGFPERTDPAALVVGPTGVALGRHGTLFVADTAANRIAAIPDALTRTHPLRGGGITVSSDGALMSPLGLAATPGGDLVAANGGDGSLVEVSPFGGQLARTVEPAGAGTLFGLAVLHRHQGIAFVDDGDNTVRLLH
jgi:sugar lactone lactonase YvrE